MNNTNFLVLAVFFLLVCLPQANAASAEQATHFVNELNKNITVMRAQNLPTEQLFDLLQEMRAFNSRQEFDLVEERNTQALSLIKDIYSVADDLAQAWLLFEYTEVYERDDREAREECELAKRSYARGDLTQAKYHIDNCKILLVSLLEPKINETHDRAQELLVLLKSNPATMPMANGTILDVIRAYDDHKYSEVLALSPQLEKINETAHSVLELHKKIVVLRQTNHSTSRFEDAADELTILYERGLMSEFTDLLLQTNALLDSVVHIAENISQTRKTVDELTKRGVDTTRASGLLELAQEEFLLENYQSAESYNHKATAAIQQTQQEGVFSTLLKKAREQTGLLTYIKKHWILAIFFVIGLTIFALAAYEYSMQFMLNKRIENLKKESFAITQFMITLQEKYYKDHLIDKQTYTAGFSQCQIRQDEVRELIPRLELKKKRAKTKGFFCTVQHLRKKLTPQNKTTHVLNAKEEK